MDTIDKEALMLEFKRLLFKYDNACYRCGRHEDDAEYHEHYADACKLEEKLEILVSSMIEKLP